MDLCPAGPLLRSLRASQGRSSAHNGLDNNSGNDGECTALPGLPSSCGHLTSVTSKVEYPLLPIPGAGAASGVWLDDSSVCARVQG